MPVHPEILRRLALLPDFTSMEQAYTTEDGRARMAEFDDWSPAATLPPVPTDERSAPGPHGAVPVRLYEPPDAPSGSRPCAIWFHGGGFTGGDLDMREADWTAREVCARGGAVVVSVGYTLAAEGARYPVPHDDAVAALTWVRDHATELGIDPARISCGGASAGANLACGAVLRLRDRDGWVPAALGLVYPVLHARIPSPSVSVAQALNELPTMFQPSVRDREYLTHNYIGADPSAADGYAMPANAILDGMCPTLVLNAEYDYLRSSGEAFAADLARTGVDVTQVKVPGLLHGFLNLPADLPAVDDALETLAEFLLRRRQGARGPSTVP